MFDDRAERVGRKERERADDDDHADEQRDEDRRMGRKRADAFGHGLFSGKRTRERQRRNRDREASEHHVDARHRGCRTGSGLSRAKADPLFALVEVNA